MEVNIGEFIKEFKKFDIDKKEINFDNLDKTKFPQMFSMDALINDLGEYGYEIRIVPKKEKQDGIYFIFIYLFRNLLFYASKKSFEKRKILTDELYNWLKLNQKVE